MIAKKVLSHATSRGGIGTCVVDNGDALVVSVEGTLGVVGQTTGPGDGTRSSIGRTSGPCSELDLHGGLGIAIGARGIGIGQSSDDNVVDHPVDGGGCPLDGVEMELACWVCDGMEFTTIIC